MYHFIVNPSARGKKGNSSWQVVLDYLTEKGIDFAYYFTNPDVPTDNIIKNIYKTPGKKKIVILGGDGTLNSVVNGLSDEELDKAYIGYIPTGSGNDFARSLKLSKDPLTNLKRILHSKNVLSLDIGQLTANNKEFKFVVSSGAGYDGMVCKLANESKIKSVLNLLGLGRFIYIIQAVNALFKSPFAKGRLIIDGEKVINFNKMFFVISTIHLYEGGGISFAPDASPTDGKLSVAIAHSMSRFQLVIMLLHVLVGKQSKLKGVELFNCTHIQVELDKEWVLHIDGEYPGTFNSFEVICLAKKLKLMV